MGFKRQSKELKIPIYEQGLDEHPWSFIGLSNFLILLMMALGTYACYLFHPWAAMVYLLWSLIMCYVVLRKLVCANCYYYGKRCDFGWGLISAKLFKKGNIEEFNDALPVVLTTYSIMMFLPLILLGYTMTYESFPNFLKLILIIIILIMIISFMGPTRKKGCFHCKMRIYCKGSAAKLVVCDDGKGEVDT
jgi:hypothetical protein